MDLAEAFDREGFSGVLLVDGVVPSGTLILAFMRYEAEREVLREGAWIHPYYRASQAAYEASRRIIAVAARSSLVIEDRPDILVKPVFARLPELQQGRNTLSYLRDAGSRFHVQVLAAEGTLPGAIRLQNQPKPLRCGDCRLCMDACPTGAIDEAGFHRERCLRNWQASGQVMPESVRGRMGNRLLGCDACQRCCPMNPEPAGDPCGTVPLRDLLQDTKACALRLRSVIGANYAIPNRLLAQACILAGCSGDSAWASILRGLCGHPSRQVGEHAAWALRSLEGRDEAGMSAE